MSAFRSQINGPQRAVLKRPGGQRGFSLVEVLVAGTVFALGLAGFSALLLTGMVGAAEARFDTRASAAATDLAELLRLNPSLASGLRAPPGGPARRCDDATPCTPPQQAEYDYRRWQNELAGSIPNARGLVCRDGTPFDGVQGDGQCDGAGPLVIKVFWPGRRSDARGRPQPRRHVLEVG